VTIGNAKVKPGRRTTISPGNRPRWRDTNGQKSAAEMNKIPRASRRV